MSRPSFTLVFVRRATALAGLAALLAGAIALAPSCTKRRATYVTVTVAAEAGVVIPGITEFRSTVTNDGESDVETFEAPGGTIDLGAPGMSSESYTIDLRRRTGIVDVFVEALNAGGLVVAMGNVQTVVAPMANWSIAVQLQPTGVGVTDGGLTDSGPPGTDAMPPITCGNGFVDPGEDCDDGDMDDTDFCDGCSINAITASTAATLQAAEPRVAMRDSGEILLVWIDISGASHDVLGRRFDAEGLPLDPAEVLLNANQPPNDEKPDVAIDPATGDFVVVWHSCAAGPTTGCGVFARIFAWDMTPQMNAGGTTDELLVNLPDPEEHVRPSVAWLDSGFVVTWQATSGVKARLFDPTGVPLDDPFGTGTAPFDVPEIPDPASCSPHVASGADDRFVIAWGTDCTGFDATSITARLFPNGAMPQAEVALPVAGPGPYRTPTVAMATSSMPVGAFLVVWEAEATGDTRIEAAGFNGLGTKLAFIDIAGATDPGIDRRDPIVGYNPGDGMTGHFIAGWRETSGTGGLTTLGVRGRLVHPSGTTVNTSFTVEAALVAAGDTPSPRVVDATGSATGFWTVAWRTPTGVSFRLYPTGFRP